jgi:hypothetical protein
MKKLPLAVIAFTGLFSISAIADADNNYNLCEKASQHMLNFCSNTGIAPSDDVANCKTHTENFKRQCISDDYFDENRSLNDIINQIIVDNFDAFASNYTALSTLPDSASIPSVDPKESILNCFNNITYEKPEGSDEKLRVDSVEIGCCIPNFFKEIKDTRDDDQTVTIDRHGYTNFYENCFSLAKQNLPDTTKPDHQPVKSKADCPNKNQANSWFSAKVKKKCDGFSDLECDKKAAISVCEDVEKNCPNNTGIIQECKKIPGVPSLSPETAGDQGQQCSQLDTVREKLDDIKTKNKSNDINSEELIEIKIQLDETCKSETLPETCQSQCKEIDGEIKELLDPSVVDPDAAASCPNVDKAKKVIEKYGNKLPNLCVEHPYYCKLFKDRIEQVCNNVDQDCQQDCDQMKAQLKNAISGVAPSVVDPDAAASCSDAVITIKDILSSTVKSGISKCNSKTGDEKKQCIDELSKVVNILKGNCDGVEDTNDCKKACADDVSKYKSKIQVMKDSDPDGAPSCSNVVRLKKMVKESPKVFKKICNFSEADCNKMLSSCEKVPVQCKPECNEQISKIKKLIGDTPSGQSEDENDGDIEKRCHDKTLMAVQNCVTSWVQKRYGEEAAKQDCGFSTKNVYSNCMQQNSQ